MPKILRGKDIAPARGKLGVLMPGIGAVSSTLLTGVFSARRGLARPIGSLTQMGKIRLGKRTERRVELIRDFVDLAGLDDMVFGGWDCFPDSAYEAARKAKVLTSEHIEGVREELKAIEPMPAVFDRTYVQEPQRPPRQEGPLEDGPGRDADEGYRGLRDAAQDVAPAHVLDGLDRGLPRLLRGPRLVKDFEAGLKKSSPDISPSQIYAYAALKMKLPYINGAPHITTDCPALLELAAENGLPVCGKDFKTGQTLMKTMLAPGFEARLLGISGWFSTNILGNRDGEVLDRSGVVPLQGDHQARGARLRSCSRTSIRSSMVISTTRSDQVLSAPGRQQGVVGQHRHLRLAGHPMQIKINFLCRDSILAAPVVLDLILFTDLAPRAGMHGDPGMAVVLFQEPDGRQGPLPRERPLRSAEQAPEYPALLDAGRAHPPYRPGLLLRSRGKAARAEARPGIEEGIEAVEDINPDLT